MLIGERFKYSNDGKRIELRFSIDFQRKYNHVEVFTFNGTELDGVEALGEGLFSNMEKLKRVILPNTVTRIGKAVFSGCKCIENINFLHSEITRIGEFAFADCTGLKSATIPLKVRKIEDGVFAECSSLEEVILHDKISHIGWFAFQKTNIKHIRLPKNLKLIEGRAFEDSSLEEIEIPETLTVIRPRTFENTKLKQVLIPDNIKELEWSAFYGCELLEKLYIPEAAKVNKIGFSETQKTVIYTSGKSDAFACAKKENIAVIEIASSKDIEIICEKDNEKLLEYLLKKYTVEEWYFSELFMKPAIKANAVKCLEALEKWRKDNFDVK